MISIEECLKLIEHSLEEIKNQLRLKNYLVAQWYCAVIALAAEKIYEICQQKRGETKRQENTGQHTESTTTP